MVWRELAKAWHDTTVDYCDVCGNLLVRNYWEFTDPDGRAVRACRPDDEDLLATLTAARARRASPSAQTGGPDGD